MLNYSVLTNVLELLQRLWTMIILAPPSTCGASPIHVRYRPEAAIYYLSCLTCDRPTHERLNSSEFLTLIFAVF